MILDTNEHQPRFVELVPFSANDNTMQVLGRKQKLQWWLMMLNLSRSKGSVGLKSEWWYACLGQNKIVLQVLCCLNGPSKQCCLNGPSEQCCLNGPSEQCYLNGPSERSKAVQRNACMCFLIFLHKQTAGCRFKIGFKWGAITHDCPNRPSSRSVAFVVEWHACW